MKTLTKTVYYYLLATVIVTIASCNNQLTREKAFELVSQNLQFPSTVTERLAYGEVYYSHNFGGANISVEKYLQQEGVITFNYVGEKKDFFFSYAAYDLLLTQTGEQYKVGETTNSDGITFYLLRAADKELVAITGIQDIQENEMANVEYTWKYSNITPIGKAYTIRSQQLGEGHVYDDNRVFHDQVIMVKYDDGWRIQE